ncbi:MAG TPA: helix-turn-helix domain-containing protein [Spirochaetia bacterium]|nr:helix-turn-helix domain-containing protein [Spirochaetia bacterium]
MVRVMIVEDEPSAADRYASYVAQFGHGFVVSAVCHHPAEAMSSFSAVQPDVVLTDVRMPGENGLGMVKRLREGGWKGEVVVISGYDDFSYAREAIHLDAAEYLLKPIFPEDMNRMLERLLCRFEEHPSDESIEILLIGELMKSLPKFAKRALQFVTMNYQHRVSLRDAAQSAFVSSAYLSGSFKRLCGYTFVDYLRRYRVEVAKRLLATTTIPLEEIAAKVGIYDTAYFNKLFKRVEHLTPGRYRRLCGGQAVSSRP